MSETNEADLLLRQNAMRDQILDLIQQQDFLDDMPLSKVNAAAACMGAAAVLVALLHEDDVTEVSQGMAASFPERVRKRAAEIDRGEFDHRLERRNH